MRYFAFIEITYVGDQDIPNHVSDSLMSAVSSHIDKKTVKLEMQCHSRNVLVLCGSFQGDTMRSPLKAITILDEALQRSLAATGLFEEFDVSCRSLGASPATGGTEANEAVGGLRRRLRDLLLFPRV
jgi:hypothetical protein